jgi:hypothetical protein
VNDVMQRFLGALSLTALMLGLTAVTQVQPQTSKDVLHSFQTDFLNSPLQPGLKSDLKPEIEDQHILTRAEFARILVTNIPLPSAPQAPLPIADLPPSHWAYDEVQTVLQSGLMTKYQNGQFHPNEPLTRAEGFSILAKAQGKTLSPTPPATPDLLKHYPDAGQIPIWARGTIAHALRSGLLNVRKGDRINPLTPMTVGDLAYALKVYLKAKP